MKTLNDLIRLEKDELTFGGYTKDVLQCDAIIDIKEIRKNFKHGICNFSCNPQDNLEEYIKWKFNITEEDLE